MTIKNVTLRLLSTALAFGWLTTASAQQPKVIEIVATDGGAKTASIYIDGENLLLEPGDNSLATLFTAEAVFTINHRDKSYSVHSYNDLQNMAGQKAGKTARPQGGAVSGPGVEFRLTEETDTISGARVRKMIEMRGGKPEAELWVNSDLVPAKVREAGEKIMSALPEDHWKRGQGSPGMPEIIMMYGIPLKMVHNGRIVYQARILHGSSPGKSLQVPSDYKRLGN
jgi:hypothetical protein